MWHLAKVNLAITLACVVLLGTSQAEAKIAGCFERVYDKSHVRQHVGQMVKAIQLQIGVQKAGPADDEEDGDEDSLAIRLIDRHGLYYANIVCSLGEDEAECRNETNREKIAIAKTSRGVKVVLGTPVTFQLEGEEKQLTLPNDGENQTYALVRVSDAQCSYFSQ